MFMSKSCSCKFSKILGHSGKYSAILGIWVFFPKSKCKWNVEIASRKQTRSFDKLRESLVYNGYAIDEQRDDH